MPACGLRGTQPAGLGWYPPALTAQGADLARSLHARPGTLRALARRLHTAPGAGARLFHYGTVYRFGTALRGRVPGHGGAPGEAHKTLALRAARAHSIGLNLQRRQWVPQAFSHGPTVSFMRHLPTVH